MKGKLFSYMDNGMIWIGAVCPDSNACRTTSLEEICEHNSRAYITGSPEMIPICAGEGQDIVKKKMELIRDLRRREVADFEIAITECLTEAMQGACIFVCPDTDMSDARAYEKDWLKIVSHGSGRSISLEVDLSHYYARYKALSDSGEEYALAGVADEIKMDISSFCTDIDG